MNDFHVIDTDFSFVHGLTLPFFLMMVFGIAMLLITPPFQTPDEPAHFYRSWQIATLQPIELLPGANAGAYLPRNLNRFVKHATGNLPFNPDEKVPRNHLSHLKKYRTGAANVSFYPFANTVSNHPLVYLPQTAGIRLGCLLSDRLLIPFYLGRFFNLIAWAFCVLAAVRIFPSAKYLFLCIALMPMSLFQASSLSADAMVNASILFFFALILRISFRPDPVDGKVFWWVLVAAVPVLIGKSGYFPLVLLILLIPARQFGSIRRQIYFTLSWMACFGLVLVFRIRQLLDIEILRQGVSRNEQVRFILADPARYAGILAHTCRVQAEILCRSFIGVLGWMDVHPDNAMVIAYFLFILFVSLTGWIADRKPSVLQKTIALLLCFGNLILLMTFLYTNWTPVGSNILIGFQGRYMIPLAPVFFLIFTGNPISAITHRKFYPVCFYSFIGGTLIYYLYLLIERYHGFRPGCYP